MSHLPTNVCWEIIYEKKRDKSIIGNTKCNQNTQHKPVCLHILSHDLQKKKKKTGRENCASVYLYSVGKKRHVIIQASHTHRLCHFVCSNLANTFLFKHTIILKTKYKIAKKYIITPWKSKKSTFH